MSILSKTHIDLKKSVEFTTNLNINIGNVACKKGKDYKSIFMEGFLDNIKKLKQDRH